MRKGIANTGRCYPERVGSWDKSVISFSLPSVALLSSPVSPVLSAMIRGAEDGSQFHVRDYSEEEVERILEEFFSSLAKNWVEPDSEPHLAPGGVACPPSWTSWWEGGGLVLLSRAAWTWRRGVSVGPHCWDVVCSTLVCSYKGPLMVKGRNSGFKECVCVMQDSVIPHTHTYLFVTTTMCLNHSQIYTFSWMSVIPMKYCLIALIMRHFSPVCTCTHMPKC